MTPLEASNDQTISDLIASFEQITRSAEEAIAEQAARQQPAQNDTNVEDER